MIYLLSMIALASTVPAQFQADPTLKGSAAYTQALIQEYAVGDIDSARALYRRVSTDRRPDVVEVVDGADNRLDTIGGRSDRMSEEDRSFSRLVRVITGREQRRMSAHFRRIGTRQVSTLPNVGSSWLGWLKSILGVGRYAEMARDPESFRPNYFKRDRLEDQYQGAMIREKAMDYPASARRRYTTIVATWDAGDPTVRRSIQRLAVLTGK
jgi:hypothetical protein